MITVPAGVKKQHRWAVIFLVTVVLFGYYRVFVGADIFFHEDHVSISNYSYGNSLGNGWRPDKGLGISSFFGDGIWHPWAPLSLWEKVVPSRVHAYTSSVLLLAVLAAISLYFFLRRILPSGHYWTAVLLAPMIVFCCDQSGYYFLRLSISFLIGMPLSLMVLHDHFEKPFLRHALLTALIFTFVVAFGNLWSLTQLLSLGFFFMLSYYFYHKPPIKKIMARFTLFYIIAGACFILLSAWLLYSFLWETLAVGYMREKAMGSGISFAPNIAGMVDYFFGILLTEWLPLSHNLAGIGYKPLLFSYNVNVVFPLVFIFFLFRRAQSFWEYSLKFIISVFFVHAFLQRGNVFGYGDMYSLLNNASSRLITMYDASFPLQIGMIGIFISLISAKTVIVSKGGRALQRTVAFILSGFYLVLLGVSLMAAFFPDAFKGTVDFLIREVALRVTAKFSFEFLSTVAAYNIDRVAEVVHWYTLLYYLSCLVAVGVFLRDGWLKRAAGLSKVRLSAFFLINAVLMSWTIYPLSEKKLAWEKDLAANFKPTDRFYYVLDRKSQKTLESFESKYSKVEGGGHRERQLGLLEPPGLAFSGLKSFEARSVGEFIYQAFNGDGNIRLSNLRLYYGGPVRFHELLDMAAVKYYYSDFALKDLPVHVLPWGNAKQLYIYENTHAWPYFYLAERVRTIAPEEYPQDIKTGTAYVYEDDKFSLPPGQKGKVDLKDFSFGDLKFSFESAKDEFFVIADAWHPLWRATSDEGELEIVKANKVFKGVRLPAGKYEFRLFFDPTPYKAGISISLFSLAAFWVAWIWARQKHVTVRD